jgi:Ca2+-binding EF-hand superfamily protein
MASKTKLTQIQVSPHLSPHFDLLSFITLTLNLSFLQLEEIREIFERIDLDGGGTIDSKEISTAMKLFGFMDEEEKEEETAAPKPKVAENLDFEAFVNHMKKHSEKTGKLFDATDHLTEQFLLFAAKEPDSESEDVFIK